MFIKSLQIGLMGFLLCAANAWAGPASIQGIVKDAKGQPIKGADVRVESQRWQTALQYGKNRYEGSLHFTGSTTRRLSGFAGSQWCSEGVHWQHENQVRSGNTTEL